LKEVGIIGKIGKWIYNFLTNRTQRVLVDGAKSIHVEVTSSVPQGTVLAPILFLIMISDINKNVRDSKVSSFADDTKISRVINNEEDVKVLQRDINAIFEWADENNMYFNGDKFVTLQYRIKND
jgi:ribonuclease P/MRP protein subunit RPP40